MVIKQGLPFDIKYLLISSISILDVLAAAAVNGSCRRRITGIRGTYVTDADWTTIERRSNADWTALVRHPHADRTRVARWTPANAVLGYL